jgi:hypothetical protein
MVIEIVGDVDSKREIMQGPGITKYSDGRVDFRSDFNTAGFQLGFTDVDRDWVQGEIDVWNSYPSWDTPDKVTKLPLVVVDRPYNKNVAPGVTRSHVYIGDVKEVLDFAYGSIKEEPQRIGIIRNLISRLIG